jgi:uncharacterized phage-associated protein
MSISSLQAAYEICKLSNWSITNLQVQKILYLAHMVYLGQNKDPLIKEDEKFEAWMYGPVLPQLYNQLKIFGSTPIQAYFFSLEEDEQTRKEKLGLKNAWDNLKNKKSWELVGLTHRENGAWAKVYDSMSNKTITNSLILEEYKIVTDAKQ